MAERSAWRVVPIGRSGNPTTGTPAAGAARFPIEVRRPVPRRTTMPTTIGQIEEFLALKRIAVVGVSRDPKQTSYTLWQELRQRRYDAVPVNPAATEIDGVKCVATVIDI